MGGGGEKGRKKVGISINARGVSCPLLSLGRFSCWKWKRRVGGGKGGDGSADKKLSKSQRSTRWKIAFFLKKSSSFASHFSPVSIPTFQVFFFLRSLPFPSCCRIRAICLSSLFLWRGHFSPLHWKKKKENETRFVGGKEIQRGMDAFLGSFFLRPHHPLVPPGRPPPRDGGPSKAGSGQPNDNQNFPPSPFWGGRHRHLQERKKLSFFPLGIPRPHDFLGQPSDSVVVPMCTLFCGPDTSGAMGDRTGRCAERKINGSTTLAREREKSAAAAPFLLLLLLLLLFNARYNCFPRSEGRAPSLRPRNG